MLHLYRASKSLAWWIIWLIGLSIIWGALLVLLLINFEHVLFYYVGGVWALILTMTVGALGVFGIAFTMPVIGDKNGSPK